MSAGPGRTLGKYQLIAEIARGGMGIVYLAHVQGPGGFTKLVVVKELKPELVEEPAFLTMFLDEARLAARLNHSNIVQTNEVGSEDHRYFMAMDYLDGRALDRIRRRVRATGTPLPLPMQLRVICDVLAGLDYAHTLADFDGSPLHIVHRDVSPQNVFVTFDGQVKLLDFGIAKAAGSMHETVAGVLKGKVSYMAPEQARGQKVDLRADVFSAGVMLWEALTGRRLREGQNGQEALWALATADLPRASSVRAMIPPELDEICARSMAFDREQRYPSAGAFHDELEDYIQRAAVGVSSRELGAHVAELFREDRAATSALIEQHIARARAGAARGELPIIDVAASGGNTTPSNAHAARTSNERAGRPTEPPSNPSLAGSLAGAGAGAGSLVPGSTLPGTAAPPSLASGSLPAVLPPGSGLIPQTQQHTQPQTDSLRLTRNTRAMRFALPALGVVAIIALVLVTRSKETPASAATPPPAAAAAAAAIPAAEPPAPAPAPAPAPRKPQQIEVTISVTPATALVTIDGAEITGNPVHARYEADGVMHNIRAAAPGYVAKTKAVAFDGDVSLELALEKVPAAPPARVAAPARAAPARAARPEPREVRAPEPPPPAPVVERPEPPAPRPTTTEVSPTGGTKPRRTIDTTYPGDNAPAGGTKPRRPIDSSNPYGAE